MKRLERGRAHLVAVVLVLLCAGALRVYFVLAHSAFMQSDEAVWGLMAKHIVTRGELPIFAYGEDRSGAIITYLVAPLFHFLGVSNLVFKGVTTAISLVFVYLVYLLAKRIGGAGVGLLALVLAAFAPPFLIMWSVHAAAEYLIMLVCGASSLLLCDNVLFRRKVAVEPAGASYLVHFALLGLVLGIGLWTSPLIVSFIGAVWAVLFVRDKKCFFRLSFVIFVLFFALGYLPALLFNLSPGLRAAGGLAGTPNWVSVRSLLSGSTESPWSRIVQVPRTLAQVVTVSMPVLVGGSLWEYETTWPRRSAAFVLVGFWLTAAAFTIARRLLPYLRRRDARAQALVPVDPPILQFLLTLFLFAISQYRWLLREPRYLIPVFVFLPIAGACFLYWLQSKHRVLGASFLALVFVLNVASTVQFSESLDPDHGLWPKDEALIAYLVENGIHHPVADYWIAYSIAFESDEQVIPVPIGRAKFDLYKEFETEPASTHYLFPKRDKEDRYFSFFGYGVAGPQWTSSDFVQYLRDRGVPEGSYRAQEFERYVLYEVPQGYLNSREITSQDGWPAPDYYAQASRYLASVVRPGDLVVVDPPEIAERLDVQRLGGIPVLPAPERASLDEKSTQARLTELAREHLRLFLLLGNTGAADPGSSTEGWLNRQAYRADEQWIGDLRLVVYGTASGSLPALPAQRVEVTFDEGIELTGFDVGVAQARPGDLVPITLFWRVLQPVRGNWKVFLHVLDDQGRLVAQRDSEPVGGLRPTSTWNVGEEIVDRYGVLLPQSLPPGEYQLAAGLYNPVSGQRLTTVPGGDKASGDSVVLGAVRVAP